MQSLSETIIDTNDTVSTEDRFALRKFIENFLFSAKQETENLQHFFDESFIATGFKDYPLFKQQFNNRLQQRMRMPNSFIRIPKLFATTSGKLFTLKGTYEEFQEGILVTEGGLDVSIIKREDEYKIIKMHLYPRMLLQDDEE